MKKVLVLSSLLALGAVASYGSTQLCSSLPTPNQVSATALAGFSCEIGDKIFSNFTETGLVAGESVSFAGGGTVYTLHLDSGTTPITNAFTFGFTVSVDTIAQPANFITQILDQMFTQQVGGGSNTPNESKATITHTPGGSVVLTAGLISGADQTNTVLVNSTSDIVLMSWSPNGNIPAGGAVGQLSFAQFGITQSSVPEPMTFSLMGAGLLGLGLLRKRISRS